MTQVQEAKELITKLVDKVNSLKEERSKLNDEISTLKAQIANYETGNSELTIQNNTLNEEVKVLNEKISSLSSALNSNKLEKDTFEEASASYVKDLQSLNVQLTEANQKLQVANSKIEAEEDALKKDRAIIEDLNDKVAKISKEYSDEVNLLKSQLDEEKLETQKAVDKAIAKNVEEYQEKIKDLMEKCADYNLIKEQLLHLEEDNKALNLKLASIQEKQSGDLPAQIAGGSDAQFPYRLGRISEKNKNKFVVFINALYKDIDARFIPYNLRYVGPVCDEIGLDRKTADIFVGRLKEMKTSTGEPLMRDGDTGTLCSNFTADQLISYTTEIVGS